MKTIALFRMLLALSICAPTPAVFAQLTIPGADSSDGALNITSNTVIDLSQAISGTWSNNNSANAGKGIYDANKWAVVFKYSSVNIASNVAVSFKNHPTFAPVVWLVSSNVTVSGLLDLTGQNSTTSSAKVPEPGPGGFRGGARPQNGLGAGGGFGPGGYYLDSGSYANYHSYGNPQIIPLLGGSGGAAHPNEVNNGGAGGGAILIASSGTTTLSASGTISVYGGNSQGNGLSGSGGAVRLIADQILGSGRIEAGSQVYPGRIRIEANSASPNLSLNPLTIPVSPTPVTLWPASTAPTVKVVSVAGQSAPVDPKAVIDSSGADLAIANTNAVTITLQSANFPTNGTVNVYIKPRNAAQSILQASFVSGNTNLATWQLTTTMPVSHAVIQARAVSN